MSELQSGGGIEYQEELERQEFDTWYWDEDAQIYYYWEDLSGMQVRQTLASERGSNRDEDVLAGLADDDDEVEEHGWRWDA